MSELSLLRGVYAEVAAYGTLIDNVIKRLGQGESDLLNPDRKELGQLLIDASIRASNRSPLRL